MRKGDCAEMVTDSTGWHRYQCSKKATRDGYCGTHHPDAVTKRRDKQSAAWREKSEQREAEWNRRREANAALAELPALRLALAAATKRAEEAEGELENERKVCLELAERVDGVAREDRFISLLEEMVDGGACRCGRCINCRARALLAEMREKEGKSV